jgi:hypothetical protein
MSGLGGSYIGVGVVGRLSCVSDGGVEVRLVRWLGRELLASMRTDLLLER